MELVPAVRPSKWLVGPGGEVQRYTPPPARNLTSGQQHAVYRIAMAHALRLLEEHGFHNGCIEQASTAIWLHGHGMDINISIREPSKVAYVTSVPGDSGKRRVIGQDMNGNNIYARGPGVVFASDEIDCRYVVEVQCSQGSSSMPVYVVIPAGETQPVKYVLKNILMLIASMASKKLPDHLERELNDDFQLLTDDFQLLTDDFQLLTD